MSAIVSTIENQLPEKAGADRVGVIASVLCAIHCAITPILLLFAPAFGKIWSHPASHWIVAIFVVPLALVMVVRGFHVHRKRWIVATGLIGVALVIIGAIIPYWEPQAQGSSAANVGQKAEEEISEMEEAAASKKVSDSANSSEVFTWTVEEPMPGAESAGDSEVFTWTAGDPLPGAECMTTDGEQCLDSCCPSLITDSEGNTKLHIPPASIVTTLGGFALICTHLGNLCACRSRRQTDCCSSTFC